MTHVLTVSKSPCQPRAAKCQDVLLPYMSDPRHASDTLFLVMEEDWRLYVADTASQVERLDESMEAAGVPPDVWPRKEPSTARASTSRSLQPVYVDHVERVWREKNPPYAGASASSGEPIAPPAGASGWLERTTKPARSEFQTVSQHLVDLVRFCTAAHRKCRGDLVWLCWDGDTHADAYKFPRPSHGSMLLGVSHFGAQQLRANWDNIERGHFDVSLKTFLEREPQKIRSSFVVPSVGHYATHSSGVLLAERAAQWKSWWVQEGVRDDIASAHVPRQVWEWARVRGRCVTQPVDEPNLSGADADVLDWRTFYCEDAQPMRPPAGFDPDGPPRQSLPVRERPHRAAQEMQEAFDRERMVGPEQPTTRRQRRKRRAQLTDAGFRIFTNVIFEAWFFTSDYRGVS